MALSISGMTKINHVFYLWVSKGSHPDRLELVTDNHAEPISRSGKSSISNVVFHKMPPSETLFLEATTQIKKEAMQ